MQANENQPQQVPLRRKLTKKELANHLQVTVRTIDNYIRQRRLPFLKIGKSVRFDLHRVEEALKRWEIREISR